MTDDFATLYISNDIDNNYKIKYSDIFNEIIKYIRSKNINVKIIHSNDKQGRTHIHSFIDSITNKDLQWRIKLNIEYFENYSKLYMSLVPKFKSKKILNEKETEDIVKDISYFKDNIGNIIKIKVNNINITFEAFSYSSEKKIYIGESRNGWKICGLTNRRPSYLEYVNGIDTILNDIKTNKPVAFTFQIVNLTKYPNNNKSINAIKDLLKEFGVIKNYVYNINDYTQISDNKIMYIILIEKNKDQIYCKSKQFFLNNRIPFQHIKVDGVLLSNKLAQKTLIMEIYKKMHMFEFFLLPNHLVEEQRGFIYLDFNWVHHNESNDSFNYLVIFYALTASNIKLKEKWLSNNDIEARIINNCVDLDEKYIVKIVEHINNNLFEGTQEKLDPIPFNLVFAKNLTLRSIKCLVEKLKEKNISIDKVYYVNKSKLKFVDNTNYYAPNTVSYQFEIYYKIIGKNIAVIKLATNKFLFPQLSSTFIKILYPSNIEISESDIKNIIWLSKKRIYHFNELKNMTLIEPEYIKNYNQKLLKNINQQINFSSLI